MEVWLKFLHSYNGKTYFPEAEWLNNDVLNLFSDSSGSVGYEAYLSGEWTYISWPKSYRYFEGCNIA